MTILKYGSLLWSRMSSKTSENHSVARCMHQLATRSKCYVTYLYDIYCNGSLKLISMYWIQMNLQSYFGHLSCEQLSRATSFSHYMALLTTSSNSSSSVTSWYVQQCILLVMVIALKMILVLSYHLFAEECDFC